MPYFLDGAARQARDNRVYFCCSKPPLTLYQIDKRSLMESAGLRRRSERLVKPNNASIENFSSDASGDADEPPRYTIDLSLPPRKRYQHMVADFKPQIETLPFLFDEVVKDLRANISVERVRWLARLLLRRVYNKEENEELRGIQETTGVEMYLLVAFNVLLDLFSELSFLIHVLPDSCTILSRKTCHRNETFSFPGSVLRFMSNPQKDGLTPKSSSGLYQRSCESGRR